MKYIFGGSGAGITIGGDGSPVFWFSLITIGPGVACGMISGGRAGYGRGNETIIDCGGLDGIMIGGGLHNFFGKSMYNGPGAGPGIMICRVGGGNGGSCV